MVENITSLIEGVRKFTRGAVTSSRYEHSERVAKLCFDLCGKFGIDADLGYLAGISHDMCKNMNDKLLLSFASRDGKPITAIETGKPSLLHGRAASVKLKEDYGVEDNDVLDAVANHTFGREGLCSLGKILYVADKIEPGRPNITSEYLDKMLKLDLDSMVIAVIKENVDYLEKKGKSVAPETQKFLKSLKKKGDKK